MPSCIHGFPTDQCAACRTCPHGLMASRCGRCAAAVTAAARRRPAPSTDAPRTETHAGYELIYDPAVSGWQYRAPDAAPSRVSYRSVFLARKAVDALVDAPPAKRTARRSS